LDNVKHVLVSLILYAQNKEKGELSRYHGSDQLSAFWCAQDRSNNFWGKSF